MRINKTKALAKAKTKEDSQGITYKCSVCGTEFYWPFGSKTPWYQQRVVCRNINCLIQVDQERADKLNEGRNK